MSCGNRDILPLPSKATRNAKKKTNSFSPGAQALLETATDDGE